MSSPYVVVARSGSDHGDARRRAGIATRGGENELDILGRTKRGCERAADVLRHAQEQPGCDIRGEPERELEEKTRQEGRREDRPPAERARVERQLEQFLEGEARRRDEPERPRRRVARTAAACCVPRGNRQRDDRGGA